MSDIYTGLIGLAGVIIGSVIAFFTNRYFYERTRKGRAHYSAIQIVYVLEVYIGKCMDVYSNEAYKSSNRAKTPEPPKYPQDIYWASFHDNDLVYKALSFPTQTDEAHGFIDIQIKHEPFGVYVEQQYQFSKLGYMACMVVEMLCNSYDIPSTKSQVEGLKKIFLDKVDERRKYENEHVRKIWDKKWREK